MKLLTIIYDNAIDDEITELLREEGVTGYTKSFDAQGFGGTGQKLNDSIWPGANNLLLVGIENEAVAPLVTRIRQIQESFHKRPGVTVFSQDVEMMA